MFQTSPLVRYEIVWSDAPQSGSHTLEFIDRTIAEQEFKDLVNNKNKCYTAQFRTVIIEDEYNQFYLKDQERFED